MVVNPKILLVMLVLLSSNLVGQNQFRLRFESPTYRKIIKHPKSEFKDSAGVLTYLNELQRSAIAKGYLLASVDSVAYDQRAFLVHFYLGEHFELVHLSLAAEDLQFVKKNTDLGERLLTRIPFRPAEFSRVLTKIQNAYLDNGYPFVRLTLRSNQFEGETLLSTLQIEKGPLAMWEEVHIKGDSSVAKGFITALIDVKKGDLYRESARSEISKRIKQLPYLKEIKPHEILFTPDGAELFLYLESVPTSSVNGVVGLQPNSDGSKLSVTGDINLKLLNAIRRGELLNLRWQSIREKTQSLESRLNFPYLFKSAFGIEASFDLYKRDSTFLELDGTIGVLYFLSNGSYLKGFYENLSSNVLSGGSNNPTYSNLGSVRTNLYGLAYTIKNLDYIPNPRSGYSIAIESSVGDRKAQQNDSSEIIQSFTYRGKLEIEYFIPLYKKHVLRLANTTMYYGAESLYENELFRFGGLKAQRGFNEDALLASTLSISTLEYRFLLDRNSHVFAFFDQTWYENASKAYFNDTPFGFGLGFAFNSTIGMFSLSYALGKQFNNPILISDGKIHFGYIAYF